MGPTQPTEPYFNKGGWGWDGTQWRKLSLLWGYTDRYGEIVSNATMPAGHSNLIGADPPAGEVWRVIGASFIVVSGSCTEVRLVYAALPNFLHIVGQLAPVSGQLYSFTVDIVLKAGDYVYGRFFNMTLDDGGYCYFWGYKMAVG